MTRPEGMRATALLCVIGLLWSPPHSDAATYRYEAYFAGFKVGTAVVVVERDPNGYRIEGSAAARGVAAFFSDWQSDFYASGVFGDSAPELLTYGYDERNRMKRRVLKLADGWVEVTRDGQARPPRRVLGGLDILTAFFIALPAGRLSSSTPGATTTGSTGVRGIPMAATSRSGMTTAIALGSGCGSRSTTAPSSRSGSRRAAC